MGFDIEQLLDFEPAAGRCIKCLALLPDIKTTENSHKCPVCGLTAVRSVTLSVTTGVTNTNVITSVPPPNDPFNAYGYP